MVSYSTPNRSSSTGKYNTPVWRTTVRRKPNRNKLYYITNTNTTNRYRATNCTGSRSRTDLGNYPCYLHSRRLRIRRTFGSAKSWLRNGPTGRSCNIRRRRCRYRYRSPVVGNRRSTRPRLPWRTDRNVRSGNTAATVAAVERPVGVAAVAAIAVAWTEVAAVGRARAIVAGSDGGDGGVGVGGTAKSGNLRLRRRR